MFDDFGIWTMMMIIRFDDIRLTPTALEKLTFKSFANCARQGFLLLSLLLATCLLTKKKQGYLS